MLAIVGTSGKLGFATLKALIEHNLLPGHQIVCTTSSDSGAKKLEPFKDQGVQVRHAAFDEPKSFDTALQGCDRIFLISSPRIAKDFNNAPPGNGRESDHFVVLEAAQRLGVKHVYYTSLAFAIPSKAGVAQAHARTEEWIASKLNGYTILREGLYSESWPLYFGHYKMLDDDRSEVPLAGDGKINWTSIADLGLATAVIVAAPTSDWNKKAVYLSQKRTHRLAEVASMVSKARGKDVKLQVVDRPHHEKYYVEERGMEEPFIKWWSTTYDALNVNECEIHDSTLEDLLASRCVVPKKLEDTVNEMLKQ